MYHDATNTNRNTKENGMSSPDLEFDPAVHFKSKLFVSTCLLALVTAGVIAGTAIFPLPASATVEVRPIGSALSERLQAVRGLVRTGGTNFAVSAATSEVANDAGDVEISPGRARIEAIRAALAGSGEGAGSDGNAESGSISAEVSLTDDIFGFAGDAEVRRGAELLPIEVVYLDRDKAREAAAKFKGDLPPVRNSRSTGIHAEDIPSVVMGDEFVSYPWYPKEDQFSLYRLHVPTAFLPRRRTTSISYRFGKTGEKAYDEFLGSQLVHEAEGSEHSVFYTYALSDSVNFAAGIALSDTSFTVNEDTPVVKSYLDYRSLALQIAGQTMIGKAFAALPVSRTPSRKSEDVRLAISGRIYTWDRFKTSMGCGIMSSRQKRKIESLVFYAGIPGLPITFEDIFIEYESLESYLVVSKVFARNLTVHAGVDHELVRTSIFTTATKDTKSFTYPFAGLDLVLNDKAKIILGIKDGEPAGELSYTSDRDMTYTGYFRREVQVIQDSANPFDNYNLRKDIDRFGVYLTHRFD